MQWRSEGAVARTTPADGTCPMGDIFWFCIRVDIHLLVKISLMLNEGGHQCVKAAFFGFNKD